MAQSRRTIDGAMADGSHLKVVCYATAAEVPQEVWLQHEGPGALYGSVTWFQLAEAVGTRLSYLVVHNQPGGQAFGLLPVLLTPPRPGGSYDQVRRLLGPVLGRDLLPSVWYPTLIAGSWNSNLAVLPALPANEVKLQRAIWNALLSAVKRIAVERGTPCIALPFLPTDVASVLVDLVGEQGVFLLTTPNTLKEIRSTSFDNFVASCKRNMRKMIRRELRIFNEAGLEITIEPLQQVLEEMTELVLHSNSRHGGVTDREKIQELLMAQSQVLGDQMLSFCARRQGRLMAAANVVVSHQGIYGRTFGSREDRGNHMEYFALAYYAPLRYGIEHGLRWLHGGPEAYEAKLRRGFELVPLWTLFLPAAPLTSAQRTLIRHHNEAELERWRHWFLQITGRPAPAPWGEKGEIMRTLQQLASISG